MSLSKIISDHYHQSQYIFAYFIFVFLFVGLNYTADWGWYVSFLDSPYLCPDILFRFIAECLQGSVSFTWVYKTHILLMGMLYLILIRRTVDFPFIAVLYAIDIYLYMANQIRFYFAWPIILLSIYSFYKKEYVLFVVLAVIAVFSHKSVILLLPAVFLCDFILCHVRFEKALFLLTSMSILIGSFTWFDFGSGFGFNQIYAYQRIAENITFIGAIYNQIPYFVCLTVIICVHQFILKVKQNVLEDRIYRYLLILSLTPVIFVGISFYLIVFSQRFSQSMTLVWFMYLYWCYRKYSNSDLKCSIRIVSVIIFIINPFFSCVYALIKQNFYNCLEIFKMIKSYGLFV